MPLIKGELIAFDTETTGLSVWHGAMPFAFGFQNEDGEQVGIEWPVDGRTRRPLVNKTELKGMKEILENRKIRKVMHNAKFDIRMMHYNFDILLKGPFDDTMFMAHMVNGLELRGYGLKPLSETYLDYPRDDESDLKKIVVRCRNWARKHRPDWVLGYEHKVNALGQDVKSAVTACDYWLPAAVARETKDIVSKEQAEACLHYCLCDVDRTIQLHVMYSDWMTEYDVWSTYRDELELFWTTYRMEERGVCLSVERNNEKAVGARQRLLECKTIVEKAAWKGFLMERKPDLAKLFFKKRGVKPTTLTKQKSKEWPDGIPSIDQYMLKEYMADDEVVRAYLKYKANHKILGTYYLSFDRKKVKDDEGNWIIHADFRQVEAVTGRFSCANPNLQNIPDERATKAVEPAGARSSFGPRPGYAWYCLDYKQIEVYMFADIAQEPTMLKAIESGTDMHNDMTNRAFGGQGNPAAIRVARHALGLDLTQRGEKLEELWKDMGLTVRSVERMSNERKDKLAAEWMEKFDWKIVDAEGSLGLKTVRGRCKICTFNRIYGGGPSAIASQIGCSIDDAKNFSLLYGKAFPRIDSYMRECTAKVRRDGFIRTRYGRRVNIPRDFAYRGVNAEVQGSAADLLKRSMRRCDKYLRETGLDAHLLMCIHDELIFEFKRPAPIGVIRTLADIMEDHGGAFGIDMKVDIEKALVQWDQKEKWSRR